MRNQCYENLRLHQTPFQSKTGEDCVDTVGLDIRDDAVIPGDLNGWVRPQQIVRHSARVLPRDRAFQQGSPQKKVWNTREENKETVTQSL